MALTEVGKRLAANDPRSFPSDAHIVVTEGLVADLLAGRIPAEIRRKPGRSIVRTCLPDGRGGGRNVFLKIYGADGSWMTRVRSLLSNWRRGGSAASVERRSLEWAAAQGIPVPRLVSACEFRGISVLATEELRETNPLNIAVGQAATALTPTRFRAWKRDLGEEIARLTQLLHRGHRYHKDLYLCHFLLPLEAVTDGLSARGRLTMLDFLRLQHQRWNRTRWQVKDLAQLLYSTALPGISARDRLHFMHAYLGCSKLDRRGRLLLRSVEKKAERYHRKNRR